MTRFEQIWEWTKHDWYVLLHPSVIKQHVKDRCPRCDYHYFASTGKHLYEE